MRVFADEPTHFLLDLCCFKCGNHIDLGKTRGRKEQFGKSKKNKRTDKEISKAYRAARADAFEAVKSCLCAAQHRANNHCKDEDEFGQASRDFLEAFAHAQTAGPVGIAAFIKHTAKVAQEKLDAVPASENAIDRFMLIAQKNMERKVLAEKAIETRLGVSYADRALKDDWHLPSTNSPCDVEPSIADSALAINIEEIKDGIRAELAVELREALIAEIEKAGWRRTEGEPGIEDERHLSFFIPSNHLN